MTALRYLMEPENGAAATGSSLSTAGHRCGSVRETKPLLRVQNTFKSPSGGEGRSRTEADREVWRMSEAQCTIKLSDIHSPPLIKLSTCVFHCSAGDDHARTRNTLHKNSRSCFYCVVIPPPRHCAPGFTTDCRQQQTVITETHPAVSKKKKVLLGMLTDRRRAEHNHGLTSSLNTWRKTGNMINEYTNSSSVTK